MLARWFANFTPHLREMQKLAATEVLERRERKRRQLRDNRNVEAPTSQNIG